MHTVDMTTQSISFFPRCEKVNKSENALTLGGTVGSNVVGYAVGERVGYLVGYRVGYRVVGGD